MLARQVLRRYLRPHTIIGTRCLQHQTSEATTTTTTTSHDVLQFAPNSDKKPKMNPFMKVMVSGKIEYSLLEFPEALNAERYKDFFFWLKKVSDYVQQNEHVPRAELMSELSRLGVFKGAIELQYGGLNFSETELTKLIDVLSYVPWLGGLLAKTNIPVAKILQAHASEQIKNTYLTKIGNGELQPTLCYLESANKWNLDEVEATSVLADTGDHWLVNGKKVYVANAEDSNLFLVFARQTDPNVLHFGDLDDQPLSMFLVEKDLDTMIIEPAEKVVGLKGMKYATVTFKDTRVPKANLIGTNEVGRAVFVDLLAPQNQYIGGQCIGLFKRCLTNLINFTLSRKYLDKNLHECQMVKATVGELAYELFVMESLIYMTTGLEDTYQNQDVEIERCIANYHCADRCVNSILKCLKLVGPESVYGEDTTMEYLNDALPFVTFDINQDSTKNLLALLAIKYYAKGIKDLSVTKLSPLEKPGSLAELFFGTQTLNTCLPGQMHPSLKPGLLALTRISQKINNAMNLVVYRYGQKVSLEQVECAKLGEMMVNCYALAACLSRASRSYCIGLRNSQHDINMALTMSIRAERIVNRLHKDIDDGTHVAGTTYFEKIAEELYQKKGYYVEDALKRNW